MSNLILKLKYCERCGSLGLRRASCETAYCEACLRELARLPIRQLRHAATKKNSAVLPGTAVFSFGHSQTNAGQVTGRMQ
jgi:hypothetical protein